MNISLPPIRRNLIDTLRMTSCPILLNEEKLIIHTYRHAFIVVKKVKKNNRQLK